MTEEKLLTITRHKELEDYLRRNYPKGKSNREVVVLFFQTFSYLRDIEYLIDAYIWNTLYKRINSKIGSRRK